MVTNERASRVILTIVSSYVLVFGNNATALYIKNHYALRTLGVNGCIKRALNVPRFKYSTNLHRLRCCRNVGGHSIIIEAFKWNILIENMT